MDRFYYVKHILYIILYFNIFLRTFAFIRLCKYNFFIYIIFGLQ